VELKCEGNIRRASGTVKHFVRVGIESDVGHIHSGKGLASQTPIKLFSPQPHRSLYSTVD
jgi:hypothetical protein